MATRRVLIISYYFPPFLSIATQRMLGIAKAFSEAEWNVTVICSNPERDRLDESKLDNDLLTMIPEGTKVVRVNEPWYRSKKLSLGRGVIGKIIRGLSRYLEPYDAYGAWSRAALKVALSEVAKAQYDLVVISVPPHSLLALAERLMLKLSIPVSLDFRDNWTSALGAQFSTPLHLYLAKRLETKALKSASFLSAVQVNLLENTALSPDHYMFMPNGFVPSSFPSPERLSRNKKYTIAYMGTLYKGRDPEPIFKAVARLIELRPDLTRLLAVEFWGWVYSANLEELMQKYGTGKTITWHEPVAYAASLEKMVQADSLLLILPQGNSLIDTVLTGKIYEYLYTGKTIIALVPPSGAAAHLIQEKNAGYIVDPQDFQYLADVLIRELDAFSQGERKPIMYRPIPEYERNSVSKSFVERTTAVCAQLEEENKGCRQ